MKRPNLYSYALLLTAFVAKPVLAVPFDGGITENALLAKLIAAHGQEIAQLKLIIDNTRLAVGATNDIFSLARVVKRTADLLISYDLDRLRQDAKDGLLSGFPELAELERETELLVENVSVASAGSEAFFGHRDYHDWQMTEVERRTFQRMYRTTIWPIVFPDSLKFHPDPSPAEALVQRHYKQAGDDQRRAIQKTSLGIIAKKIKALLDDAENKDDVALRTATNELAIELQNLENSTEMLNFKEHEVAAATGREILNNDFRKRLADTLASQVDSLTSRRMNDEPTSNGR